MYKLKNVFPNISSSFTGEHGSYLFFTGEHGSYLFFQEFSRRTWKLSVFPGVFQENMEVICFSRSFSGPWIEMSKFQELFKNSRSNEHQV